MVKGMAAMLCASAFIAFSCDDDDEKPADIAVTGVTLDKPTLSLAVGETAELVATVAPSDATNKNVKWESSTPAVATVSNTGKVTAVAEGTATVTVTTLDGDFKAKCEVTVTGSGPVGPTVTGVTLDKPTLELVAGETATLVATVAPDDAADKSVTWSTSAPAVATVADGVVTAVAQGTATITVTTVVGEFTATCAVTVTEPSSEPLVWEDGFEAGDFDTKWNNIDADGDTWKWSLLEASSNPDQVQPIDGQYSILTNSYVGGAGGGPLTPDNWAISEAITLNGAQNFTLAWWCRGTDPDWVAENYGIFVSTTSQTDRSTFTQVGSDFKAVNPEQQFTVDLSSYAGQTVYIAFRHYNVTDLFSMQIDKVQVFRGSGVPSSALSVAAASVPGPVSGDAAPAFFYRRMK